MPPDASDCIRKDSSLQISQETRYFLHLRKQHPESTEKESINMHAALDELAERYQKSEHEETQQKIKQQALHLSFPQWARYQHLSNEKLRETLRQLEAQLIQLLSITEEPLVVIQQVRKQVKKAFLEAQADDLAQIETIDTPLLNETIDWIQLKKQYPRYQTVITQYQKQYELFYSPKNKTEHARLCLRVAAYTPDLRLDIQHYCQQQLSQHQIIVPLSTHERAPVLSAEQFNAYQRKLKTPISLPWHKPDHWHFGIHIQLARRSLFIPKTIATHCGIQLPLKWWQFVQKRFWQKRSYWLLRHNSMLTTSSCEPHKAQTVWIEHSPLRGVKWLLSTLTRLLLPGLFRMQEEWKHWVKAQSLSKPAHSGQTPWRTAALPTITTSHCPSTLTKALSTIADGESIAADALALCCINIKKLDEESRVTYSNKIEKILLNFSGDYPTKNPILVAQSLSILLSWEDESFLAIAKNHLEKTLKESNNSFEIKHIAPLLKRIGRLKPDHISVLQKALLQHHRAAAACEKSLEQFLENLSEEAQQLIKNGLSITLNDVTQNTLKQLTETRNTHKHYLHVGDKLLQHLRILSSTQARIPIAYLQQYCREKQLDFSLLFPSQKPGETLCPALQKHYLYP